MWFGAQPKLEYISALLKDPTFSEAVELVLAEQRATYPESRTLPGEMLLRQHCELGGMTTFLSMLERLSQPEEAPPVSDMVDAWEYPITTTP